MPDKHKLKELANTCFFLYFSGITGQILAASSQILFILNAKVLASKLLLASIRYSYGRRAIRILSEKVRTKKIPLKKLLSKPAKKEDAESRAIILSPPYYEDGQLVKGVMLLKFTHTFSYFPLMKEWHKLNRLFAFILEPSWAGYADADILYFAEEADHCVIQATEVLDRALINSVLPSVPCIDTGSSNWVDHKRFSPPSEEIEKIYDAIYIANLKPIKRVYRAIDAMGKATTVDHKFRALIICAGWGEGKVSELERYAHKRAPKGSITILPGVKQPELVKFLHQSKFSILLSLKEGSNRVLFESMFTGIPTLCLAENIGVNKSYINDMTGILTYDSELPYALIHMMNNFGKYNARQWASSNISPEVTTKKLADLLSMNFGNQINNQLKIKVNTPELNYLENSLRKKDIMELFFRSLKSDSEEQILSSLKL